MSAQALRYDFAVDQTRENNTHNMTLAAVGRDKRVLDVGCSSGYLAEYLATRCGCEVTGLEPDPDAAAAAQARLGDRVVLGGTELLPTLPAGAFDVVLFADVLEHLVDPGAALRETRRLLAPGGRVVASIPNVAHADVRLLLLTGQFPYRRTGLLDSTHVRFLTRDSIPTLFQRSGYRVLDMVAKTIPLGRSEFGVELHRYPDAVLDLVRADPWHADYQYVVQAAPDVAGPRTQLQAPRGWERSRLVAAWARAFSPAEPVSLVLPVDDDDAAVERAVELITVQCRDAGASLEQVADLELVRCSTREGLPSTWPQVPLEADVATLRALALPAVDALVS